MSAPPDMYQLRIDHAAKAIAIQTELVMSVVEEFGGRDFEMVVNERYVVTIERMRQ